MHRGKHIKRKHHLASLVAFIFTTSLVSSASPLASQQSSNSLTACTDILKKEGGNGSATRIANELIEGLGESQSHSTDASLASLKTDLTQIERNPAVHGALFKAVQNEALTKTVQALWGADKLLFSPSHENTSQNAVEFACKKSGLCSNKENAKLFTQLYSQTQPKLSKITPLSIDSILQSEFNPLIDQVNAACKAAAQDFALANAKAPENLLDRKRVAAQDGTNSADMKQNQYNAKVKAIGIIHEPHVQKAASALLESRLGFLMLTKTLQTKVGVMNEKNPLFFCRAQNSLKRATSQTIAEAKTEFMKLIESELASIAEREKAKSLAQKKSVLKLYLKNYPNTVSDLLKKNSDPKSKLVVCSLIREIDRTDRIRNTAQQAVMGIGIVASIALGVTGIGSTAGALLFATVTGTTLNSVAKDVADYKDAKSRSQTALQAGATGGSKTSSAIKTHQQSEKEAKESLQNLATTVALEGAGASAGRLARIGKTSKAGITTEKNTAQVLAKTETKVASKTEAIQKHTDTDAFELYRKTITSENPDPAILKQLETKIETGKAVKMEVLDNGAIENLGRSKYVELDNGVAGVFKTNVDKLDTYQKEIAYYRLSRKMDLKVVPLTVKKEINGVEGSFQLFVKDGKSAVNKEFPTDPDIKMLDLMMGEIDRPNIGGNFMKLKDGSEIAIDNGRNLIDYKTHMYLDLVMERVRTEQNYKKLKELNSLERLTADFSDVLSQKEILELKANINKMITTIDNGAKTRKVKWTSQSNP